MEKNNISLILFMNCLPLYYDLEIKKVISVYFEAIFNRGRTNWICYS